MRRFSDYKEEIYKCSRCGLCQSVCPVYKATLSECAVSKGKFNMLNGVIKGDLSFSHQLKKYLDMCTGCNACKNFCPSDIDARKIFIAAKAEYHNKYRNSFRYKILNSYFLFKSLLLFVAIFTFVYRLFCLDKFCFLFEKLLYRLGKIGKLLLLYNSQVSNKLKLNNSTNISNYTQRAVYFDGCFNKYIDPQTKIAVEFILRKNGIDLIKKDFECCGVSYLSDGNIEQFKRLAECNVLKISDDEIDYILTDCSSCYDTIKNYSNILMTKKSEIFSKKVVSAFELIQSMSFACKKNLKIAVHVPCHEDNDLVKFVKNIKNIEYVEAIDYNKCCGFSGTFSMKYPKISEKISKTKAINYVNSGADIVLTTCPACLLGIEQGFIETGLSKNKRPCVMNLFVFLAEYCIPETE